MYLEHTMKRIKQPCSAIPVSSINPHVIHLYDSSVWLINLDTLLGNPVKLAQFYDESTDEYFFDRDADCFKCILGFYQSDGGSLVIPQFMDLEILTEAGFLIWLFRGRIFKQKMTLGSN